MNVLNIAIVYLACGMPFAIYRIVLSDKGTLETLLRSLAATLLWPLDGGKAAVRRLSRASRTLAKPRIDNIRCQIEAILFAEIPHFRHFEFRDVFDRYVGLKRTTGAEIAVPDEFFRVSGVEPTRAAVACIRRRSVAKLRHHTAEARNELMEYIGAVPSPRLFELAKVLAIELDDQDLAVEIERCGESTRSYPPSSMPHLSGSAS